jgi:hypothetical protein
MMVGSKYRILAQLGRGGMGIVYKAQHVALEEVRALKVMDPGLTSDPKFVKRFQKEARAARRLRHPNVAHVDDLEQAEDGSLFIAMEYIEGISLRQLTNTQRILPVARALAIAKGVAEGLGAAHAMGMTHRDIKPDNILLGRDYAGRETPKILDFGIVAIKESTGPASSRLFLTTQYAAPEQWQMMEGRELDGRTDFYALGVTQYEKLAGRLPFDARSAPEWMYAHLQHRPLPPSHYNPDLAAVPGLDAFVLRLLAKDRESRPAEAQVLIQEIHLLEAQSPPAPTGTLGTRRLTPSDRAEEMETLGVTEAKRLAQAKEGEKVRAAEEQARLAEAEKARAEAEKIRVAEEQRARAAEAEEARIVAEQQARAEAKRIEREAVEERIRAVEERARAAQAEEARVASEQQARAEAERIEREAQAERVRVAEERARAAEAEKARVAAERVRLASQEQARVEAEKTKGKAEHGKIWVAEGQRAQLASEAVRRAAGAEKARAEAKSIERKKKERVALWLVMAAVSALAVFGLVFFLVVVYGTTP